MTILAGVESGSLLPPMTLCAKMLRTALVVWHILTLLSTVVTGNFVGSINSIPTRNTVQYSKTWNVDFSVELNIMANDNEQS
jgi:hypothetical protein